MNTLSDALPAPETRASAVASGSRVRPLYWALRRELWENRSLYIAPLVVAALVLFGFLIGVAHIPRHISTFQIGPDKRVAVTDIPYAVSALAIVFTGYIVGAFYCLGALHNERRDRSILFWKSMPVSDLVTVLSKAIIPLVILPFILFVIIAGTQLVLFLVNGAILLPGGTPLASLWAQWPFLPMLGVLAYALATTAVWYAPICGWLLMVSAWARRAPFLWAVLPPLAVCLLEGVALGSGRFAGLLGNRLAGNLDAAFSKTPQGAPMMTFAQIDPSAFLGNPGVWLGILAAAAFLAAAVWLRRSRDLS